MLKLNFFTNIFRGKTEASEDRRNLSTARAGKSRSDSRSAYLPARLGERGNVFFTLFGAVAVVGVLGAGVMSTMRGPLSTMVEVNRMEEAKAEMRIGARLLVAGSTDIDADGYVEGVAPAAGSVIPTAVSAEKNDPWGTAYRYCSWNHGVDPGVDDIASGTILAGSNDPNNVAIVIISAGPDRTFQTSCAADPDYVINTATTNSVPMGSHGAGDDLMEPLSYADAVTASGGLWTLDAFDKATIDKELDVARGAQFGGQVRFDGAAVDPAGVAGLVIPDSSVLLDTDCDGGDTANDGIVRINLGTTPNTLELCDAGNAWVPVGDGVKEWVNDGSDNISHNTGDVSTTQGLTVGGTTSLQGTTATTLNATGATDLDSTLNVDGTSTLEAVNAKATTVTTLGATGAVDFDSTLNVDGTADFNGVTDVNNNFNVSGNTVLGDAATDTVAITGIATVGDTLDVTGKTTVTTMQATGAVELDTTLEVDGDATLGDAVTDTTAITGIATVGATLDVTGKITGSAGAELADGIKLGDAGSCTASAEGTVHYDGTRIEYCNGSSWKGMSVDKLRDIDNVNISADPTDKFLISWNDTTKQWDAVDPTTLEVGDADSSDESLKLEDADNDTKVQVEEGSDDDTIRFDTAGDERMIIDPNGNVGIGTGTDTLTSRLSVTTDSSLLAHFKRDSYAHEARYAMTNGGLVLSMSSNSGSSWSELIHALSSGRVGIGTDSPDTRLDVGGTLKIADGGEACDADREGAIKYVAADDKFYMCAQAATGWQILGTGGSGGGGSGSGSGGSSMVDGWPDAIKCSATNPALPDAIFYATYLPYSDSMYYYRAQIENGTHYTLRFGSDGTFNSFQNITTATDCNKTIAQLYANGQAFNFGGGSGGASTTVLEQTVGTSVGTNVWTSIAFDVEKQDGANQHDNATNNTRITAASDGLYEISGLVARDSKANGNIGIRLLLNGTTSIAEHWSTQSSVEVNQARPIYKIQELSAGDYVEIQFFGDGAGTVLTLPAQTYFAMAPYGSSAGGSGGASAKTIAFKANRSATQALANATWVDVQVDSEEYEIGGDNFDASTGKFTAPDDGVYDFSVVAQFDASSANYVGVMVQVEDAGTSGRRVCYSGDSRHSSYVHGGTISCSGSISLASGEVVEMVAYQNSGSSLNVGVSTYFSGFKVNGGGFDVMSGLSCTDGQVAAWNATNSAWECADQTGGSGSGSGSGSGDYLQKWASSGLALSAGTTVPFSNVTNSSSGDITASTNGITVKGGGSYRLESTVNIGGGSAGESVDYRIWDVTNSAYVGGNGRATNVSGESDTYALAFVSPSADTTYEVRAQYVSGTPVLGSHVTFAASSVGGGSGGSGSGSGSSSSNSFNVTQTSSQSIPATTHTLLDFDTEEFDTNDDFDPATDRFTPTVAGKYMLTANVVMNSSNRTVVSLYKNGVEYRRGLDVDPDGSESFNGGSVSAIVDANGTTDYFDVRVWSRSSAGTQVNGGTSVHFSGALLGGGGSGSGSGSGQDVSFSVHKNGTDQTVTAGVTTKLTWSTETFDTNDNFASDRFTPTVAGKYMITLGAACSGGSNCYAYVYKNGARINAGHGGGANAQGVVSVVVDMNGTTDYIEGYVNNGGSTGIKGNDYTYMSGILVSGGGSGGGSGSGSDTLAGLSCTDGQVASWDDGGSAWACTDAASGGGSVTVPGLSCTDGQVPVWGDTNVASYTTLDPDQATNVGANFYASTDLLSLTVTNNSGLRQYSGTTLPDGKKGYYEFSVTTGTPNFRIGFEDVTKTQSNLTYQTAGTFALVAGGDFYNGLSVLRSGYTTAAALNDTVMVAFDFTGGNKNVWFGRNGTWGSTAGGVGDPATGANPILTATELTGDYRHYFAMNSGAGTQTIDFNFGQSAFAYSPPTGFSAPSTLGSFACGAGGSGGGSGSGGGVLSNGTKNGGTAASVSESITIAEDGILIATGYAQSQCNPSSLSNVFVTTTFNVDGVMCNEAMDRYYVNNGSGKVSTSCVMELAAGTYTISVDKTQSSSCTNTDIDMHWTVFSKDGGGGSGSDTLAGLSCTSDQVAAWDGSAWACADAASGGSGSSGTAIIDKIAASGTTVDAVTIAATNDKWPDYIMCDGSGSATLALLEVYQSTGPKYRPAAHSSTAKSYNFNKDGSYDARWWFDANCGASAGDIDTICTENRCGFFGGGSGGSTTGMSVKTDTKYDGTNEFPDAIQCGSAIYPLTYEDGSQVIYGYYSTQQYQIRFDLSGNKTADVNVSTCGGSTTMAAIAADDRTIYFGTGSGSDTLSGLSCTDGQVAAWNDTGSAWECADGGSGGSSASTMVDGWPDAIICESSVTRVLIQTYRDGSQVQYSSAIDSTANRYFLSFNTDKTYNTHSNMSGANCLNKTIDELYTAELAFNFVGGGSGSGSGAVFLKCTNENSDGDGTDDIAACIEATDVSTGNYIPVSCQWSGNASDPLARSGKWLDWNGTNWRYNTESASHNCLDGSIVIANLNAGSGSGSADNLGDHTATEDIDAASNDIINIASLEFDMVAGDAPVSASDTLGGLSCSDGQVASWNNGGSAWECSTPASGADNLGNHTATTDLLMATNDISGATNISYSGTLTDTSDRRLKRDIVPLEKHGSLLEKIKGIDTYSFRMKDSDADSAKEFGVMAQELELIFPELVETADDAMGTKSVNYMGLIAPMIDATQELADENAALRGEIAAMDSQSAQMHDAVESLQKQVKILNALAADDTNKAGFALDNAGGWLWLLALAGVFGLGFGLVVRERRRKV